MIEKISHGYVPKENPEQLRNIWLRQQQSQKASFPLTAEIQGRKFRVDAGVHSPAFYADTGFFATEALSYVHSGDDVLEVGCGTAPFSVLAALKGATVTATDISPASVENARINAKLNGVELRILESDVYDGLPPNETYDIIYWNVPFAYVSTNKEGLSPLGRAVFDPQHDGLKKYILGARKHLSAGGKLLLGYSSTLGDMNAIRAYAKEAGLQFTGVASTIDPKDPKQEKRFDLLSAENPRIPDD